MILLHEFIRLQLRFLLPGSVSARLIALVLEDKNIGFAMREKVGEWIHFLSLFPCLLKLTCSTVCCSRSVSVSCVLSIVRFEALALCNTKLLHDGFFSSDSGIHEQQLTHLAAILNGWIGPEKAKDKVGI